MPSSVTTSPNWTPASAGAVRDLAILPRKGEVAPKVTEGEASDHLRCVSSPSIWQAPATSPLRVRIEEPPNFPVLQRTNMVRSPANKTGSQP